MFLYVYHRGGLQKNRSYRIPQSRHLNQQTLNDCYPLLRIDEIFDSLSYTRCYISYDLLMGHHQVAIELKHQAKSAFVTHRGLVVYKSLLFGLGSSTVTVQSNMHPLFRDNVGTHTSVYFDDVLLHAPTAPQVLVFERTFRRLIAA